MPSLRRLCPAWMQRGVGARDRSSGKTNQTIQVQFETGSLVGMREGFASGSAINEATPEQKLQAREWRKFAQLLGVLQSIGEPVAHVVPGTPKGR